MPLRLGYACICSELQKQHILVNHTCTRATLAKRGNQWAIDLAAKNLEHVLKVLEWNVAHNIFVYRMSSDMFPHYTDPMFVGVFKLHTHEHALHAIGKYAREHGIRLTFHPGQFNQVGTPNATVLASTRKDLHFHALALDLIGAPADSVMVVHGGGTFGNKQATIERWADQFWRLPTRVRRRLVIENCERSYSYQDMLELHDLTKLAIVFDTHHHACYWGANHTEHNPQEFMQAIIDTWGSRRPKVHISEQDPAKRLGAHSIMVETIPEYLLDLDLDVMVEAKGKEQAVLQLREKYKLV